MTSPLYFLVAQETSVQKYVFVPKIMFISNLEIRILKLTSAPYVVRVFNFFNNGNADCHHYSAIKQGQLINTEDPNDKLEVNSPCSYTSTHVFISFNIALF
jgi:hypothetical protein